MTNVLTVNEFYNIDEVFSIGYLHLCAGTTQAHMW